MQEVWGSNPHSSTSETFLELKTTHGNVFVGAVSSPTDRAMGVRIRCTSEGYFVAVIVWLGALDRRSSAPNEGAASAQAERPFSTGETRLGASWGATRSVGVPEDSHAPPGKLHGARVAGRTADRRRNALGLNVQIAATLKEARSRSSGVGNSRDLAIHRPPVRPGRAPPDRQRVQGLPLTVGSEPQIAVAPDNEPRTHDSRRQGWHHVVHNGLGVRALPAFAVLLAGWVCGGQRVRHVWEQVNGGRYRAAGEVALGARAAGAAGG